MFQKPWQILWVKLFVAVTYDAAQSHKKNRTDLA